jgi:hypothetical protein
MEMILKEYLNHHKISNMYLIISRSIKLAMQRNDAMHVTCKALNSAQLNPGHA